MSRIFLLGWFLILFGCSPDVSRENLERLNGYWEIERVVFPDGGSKEYKVNANVDYIQLEGMEGWRKKVRPRFDGTYQTSEDVEEFLITEKEGNFSIDYKTGLDQWSEKLTRLDTDRFSVVNEDGKRYDYKRFEPISVER